MSASLNRRDVLTMGTMGSALAAAGGVVLSTNGAQAEAHTQSSEPSYARLDTARALYSGSEESDSDSEESAFGLDAIAIPETLGERLREVSAPFPGVADVELISALLEVSRMQGDPDLLSLAQPRDIPADISAKSEELLALFVVPISGTTLGEFLQGAEVRHFNINPEAILIEKDGDRLVLTPFVAHSCSFMDWLSGVTGWF